tara:strand:- start:320 stop:3367 length:3048 start_codon:yes stop_codon:yes gene_type:complete
MDQALSSLYPTNQIGSDGMSWWIGQIESPKCPDAEGGDPKKAGRYRVRIVGVHLKEGQLTPTTELPWAHVMMPATHPYSDGGVTGGSVNFEMGNWVVGFFLDSARQQPIIMGSIGHVPGSTIEKPDNPNPNNLNGLGFGFTKHPDIKVNPSQHRSATKPDGRNENGTDAEGGLSAAAVCHIDDAPPILLGLRGFACETNPIGGEVCVEVANPNCGTESNFDKSVTNIIGDLLAANQKSGGQLGSYYVSKVNGFLYDKTSIARYHIGRVTRLVRSLMGRIQSEMISGIRKGVENLVNAVLGINAAKDAKDQIPPDPKGDHKSVKKKGNLLKRIKKVIDKILKALGCAMEDAIDRIVKWLTNLLFNMIMEAFSPAVCLITNIVDGIINQIISVVDGLISKIMGPLQSILSIVGGGINIVSSAINKVMSFLGINCSGPSGKCSKTTKVCTNCGSDEEKDDWLDELLDQIESGDTGERFTCDEAKDYADNKPTNIVFIGGIPEYPVPITDDSTPPGEDNDDNDIFFPDDDIDPGDEEEDDDDDDDTIDDIIDPILFPDDDEDDDDDDDYDPVPLDETGTPFYEITVNSPTVVNGETLVYTVHTGHVPEGAILQYKLSGPDTFTDDDVVGGLVGTFEVVLDRTDTTTIYDNDGNGTSVDVPIGKTTFSVTFSDDIQISTAEQRVVCTVQQIYENNDNTTEIGSIDQDSVETVVLADLEKIIYPDDEFDTNPVPTYQIAADKETYDEGEDIVFTITTTNVDDNTKVNYTIYGDIEQADIIGSMTGTITIRDNIAKLIIGVAEDIEAEVDESLYITLVGVDAATSVVINGTYVPETTVPEETPKIDKPTAGDPITDDDGGIIEIPISDPGDPYEEPPQVIITGEGFGATGIALLDPQGYVSEIRVTRSGLNYKKNTPEDNNVRCIIDSFTLISPGIRYTSPPDVYVNGKQGIAKAEIDDRGYVISVKILDRTKTYSKTPGVQFVGGGGAGAIAIPSMVCLGEQDLKTRGAVKIGTGTYIDCP